MDESDDDWFNKDEDELLKDLKMKTNDNELETKTEYITTTTLDEERFVSQKRLAAAVAMTNSSNLPRIPTSELRKVALSQNALEVFLYVFTQERPNFFEDQIRPNDGMDRIILYVHILAIIVDMKIPGFHRVLIKNFVMNEVLLDHLQVIAAKISKSDIDDLSLDGIISDMQTLFVQAHKLYLLTPKILETIRSILKFSERKGKMTTTEKYKTSVRGCFITELHKISTDIEEDIEPVVRLDKPFEIYPTIEDLFVEEYPLRNFSLLTCTYGNVENYLEIQRKALRTDFMNSVTLCARELKQSQKLIPALSAQVIFFKDVQIILNENFLDARRHEMLFIYVDPKKNGLKDSKRGKDIKAVLNTLKTGSLICLTTTFDFDNLILAVVTYQDAEFARNGYIAIEIVRQYNIGNIYDKKLIMFSTPAFFEPYHNVHNFLSTCSDKDFPMKEFIIFGESTMTTPKYLTSETTFKVGKDKFQPAKEPPPTSLPLNESQRLAVQQALTQKLSLIQGPPGTGKTHISVQLVKLLVENETPKPIVIVAYTNESLDKFLLKISAYTNSIARFGSQTRQPGIAKFNVQDFVQSDKINPLLKRLYFIINTEYKTAFEHLQSIQKKFDGTEEGYQDVVAAQQKTRALLEQLNTIRMFFKYYIVRDCSIIAMTTTCAAKMNFLLRLLECRIVIFEEAAEILESHVIACLTPYVEHVIMIGDHMQLKPFTSNYQHSKSCDLNVSLFERLICQNILKPTVLLTQYRMRPIIAELLCPIFYEKLKDDKSVTQYPSVRKMKENLFFVKHNVKEEKSSDETSVWNSYETKQIICLATYLHKVSEYDLKDIVVLSPYSAQVNRIKTSLPANLKSIRVMTVDSFQGLESTIVLLSLVRSNRDGHIGFLNEKNRICVALSRAKYGFYIIGDLDLLTSCSSIWVAIKDKLSSHNLIGEEFPYSDD